MIITVEIIKVVKIKNFDNKLSMLNVVSKKHSFKEKTRKED